ncbi:MAG: glycosyltransferase family 4 protein [Opitutaceae bacterium]|nr:glycosyltransferase family 4 protein [Opitutaceae bacterium]
MTSASPRLAIILSHPVQYYSPWFRWLAAHTQLNLRVFYLWDSGIKPTRDRQFDQSFAWDIDLLSGYAHEFVPNVARDPGTHHFGGLHNPSLRARLRAWAPDALLIFGYAYRTHLGLFLRPPAPLVFRGDSHLLGHPAPSWLKRTALRLLYSRCAAVTFVGQANFSYFRAFGVPASKLHFAPHCVDASRFSRTPEIETEAFRLRQELGLAAKKIVLFAGKFLPAKQPLRLLEAFIEIAPADSALVFVGDGPQRAQLEALAATRPDLSIRFLPFANQSEMPVRYALADIFVLPSIGLYETWGLAVNEAMHAGVPCLVSDRVGCQQDLVTEGETGWVFSAVDPDGLRQALARALAAKTPDHSRLRANVAVGIARYTYDQAAAGLLSALQSLAK